MCLECLYLPPKISNIKFIFQTEKRYLFYGMFYYYDSKLSIRINKKLTIIIEMYKKDIFDLCINLSDKQFNKLK